MMEVYKTIYCEIDFIKEIFDCINGYQACNPLENEDFDKIVCARKIIKDVLSQEYVIVHFDDKEKYLQLLESNEYFRRMVGRAETVMGFSKMDCDKFTSIESISDNGLNAMYFVRTGEDIAKKKGIMALTPQTINNKSLYKDFGPSIPRNSPCKWKEVLEKAYHNCNALIIFDNFLYKYKETNLYEIFDSLLPIELSNEIPFQITLFMQEEKGVSIDKEYEMIKCKLEKLRPKLHVDLTIYQCITSDFHDRAIITNHIWISCEGGFDLLKFDKRGFRTESSKSTTLHMKYPFLQDNDDSAYGSYLNFINDAIRIKRSNRYEGSQRNRLFEIIPSIE